ncbi:polyprenyl synthetase family protein [Vagococcus fluvialis]|uniref:Farnesyl diphosphate synthase n=1 Tax=Vagococcus fluvialis TaxID=2738 RepID=A0A369AWU6_9ENTE|nr:farnesyl diphosphate synthase [Vagococcus fluvialis]MBO0479256.1 polyprenyl synthetase family protein [Vagococcus fluvialis]MBO0485114.1 polyprenyl synthetase family protein [Vagococcus fluvialis]MBO0487727.1 polyprenyl synthetase family protein [Vagococcus fluvialis]MCM2138139.1 polyprenyl synthetase family protein [Vagococcus fluvialis]MDT2746839.1 polyprenyl synthetase family protein [Vagococcus fluvialis]
MSRYKEFSKQNIPVINQKMYDFLEKTSQSEILFDSMVYSLDAGGKRFRPLLLLATVDFFGQTLENSHYEIAAALEMIHTYSLIHDDLPAMDDDDLRRGKPTNHKVYGEGLAILAGDALLTESFHLVAEMEVESSLKVELIRLLAKASGSTGMIAGQVEDVLGEGKKINFRELQKMHQKKTGMLIQFAVEAGVLMSTQSFEMKKWLLEYAQNVGIAFQIRDDLLDVLGDEAAIGKKVGADEAHNKNTYVSLLGIEGATKAFENHCDLATESLQKAKGLLNKSEEVTLLEIIIEELKVI